MKPFYPSIKKNAPQFCRSRYLLVGRNFLATDFCVLNIKIFHVFLLIVCPVGAPGVPGPPQAHKRQARTACGKRDKVDSRLGSMGCTSSAIATSCSAPNAQINQGRSENTSTCKRYTRIIWIRNFLFYFNYLALSR